MFPQIIRSCRKVIPAGLLLIHLLFTALQLNTPLPNFVQFSTVSAADGEMISVDQRLLPLEANYQILDAGEGSLTDVEFPVTGNTDYPGPGMRGYPAPSPFKRIQITFNSQQEFQTFLDVIRAYFNIDAGTTNENVELQMYRLSSLPTQISDRVVGDAFSIRLVDNNGREVTRFNKPIRVTFALNEVESQSTNNSRTSVKPYQWDQDVGGWTPLYYEVSEDGSALIAVVDKPGEFALMEDILVFVPSIQ